MERERRRTWVIGSIAAAALASCVILENLRPGERPFGFNHRVHVEEEGLECQDCHMGADSADEPGMPRLGQCMLCHEDIDAEKPEERRVETLFVDGDLAAGAKGALSDEVVFSHLEHAQRADDCTDCHASVATSESRDEIEAIGMAECLACHERSAAPAECATCHTEIDRDWAPRNHELHWRKFHGPTARADTGRPAETCALCHSEKTCVSCHQEEPPDNHTNYWRRRGHPVSAKLDRDNCAACHRSDFCDRCHRDTSPMNHVGSWGGGQNTHCVGCHFPLSSEGCYTCHRSTPSHLEAAPKPADHSPGMNCRQCHGLTAPLPHLDAGDDCNLCHM